MYKINDLKLNIQHFEAFENQYEWYLDHPEAISREHVEADIDSVLADQSIIEGIRMAVAVAAHAAAYELGITSPLAE